MKQLRSILFVGTAALMAVPQMANADVVTDWNTIAVSTVSADRVNNRQTRDMAMVHAAVFDAMNAIRPYYTPAMVSITPMMTPPASAPGIEPKPPNTAAGKALSPSASPTLVWMKVMGANRTPAQAATMALIAQISETTRLTGMPM